FVECSRKDGGHIGVDKPVDDGKARPSFATREGRFFAILEAELCSCRLVKPASNGPVGEEHGFAVQSKHRRCYVEHSKPAASFPPDLPCNAPFVLPGDDLLQSRCCERLDGGSIRFDADPPPTKLVCGRQSAP